MLAKIVLLLLTFSLAHGVAPERGAAALQPASAAPRFALNDMHGSLVEVKSLRGKKLLVLYFFDIESRPSLDGLSALDLLARQHPGELVVYGVSSSPPELIKRYLAGHSTTIQLLRDTSRVRELYGARQVLPVGCIIGEDFKVLEYYQGGGAGFNSAILGRIKRELQGKELAVRTPHPEKTRVIRSAKKGQGKPAASGAAAQAPVAEPPVPEEKGPPKKLGRIIDESQW